MMRGQPTSYPASDYKEYPKSLAPDDFWGQVRRTVNGERPAEEEIARIRDEIRMLLDLNEDDTLLDLACGNGALSADFIPELRALYGTDASEYLITIATSNFAAAVKDVYTVLDAAATVREYPRPERFTKILCFGSFSYFDEDTARTVIRDVSHRFTNVSRIMIGNLPDLDRAMSFYGLDSQPDARVLKQNDSQIGIWRTRDEFAALIDPRGPWDLEFQELHPTLSSAHYRYHALLRRVSHIDHADTATREDR